MKPVITGEGYETSPGGWQREEDLDRGILPHLGILQFRPVHLLNVELDAFPMSVQSDSTDEQDDQHHVREQSRKVHHLERNQICKRCSFECNMGNRALIPWIRCKTLGERFIRGTFFHITRKINSVCFFTYDITAAHFISNYSWSAIWADTDIRLMVKTTAQSVRSIVIKYITAPKWTFISSIFLHAI